ncbi:MAG: serine/threonine-protein kinase [Deltaproteobacteria bacterium]
MIESGASEVGSLGKYSLVATLGGSAATQTYLALDPARGETSPTVFALKQVQREIAARDPRRAASFLEGARLGARMSHPNVVRSIDVGEDDGVPFVVTEFLEGQSLDVILRRVAKSGHPLPVGVALRIACDALDGAHHIHELLDFGGKPMGLVHSDINPSNVFVTYSGLTKLLDFSLGSSATEHEKTHTGEMNVRLPYVAPELLRDEAVSASSDVWSIATCLWEMLAGERLFSGKNNFQTIQNVVVARSVPTLASRRSDVPAWLDVMLARALVRDPSARFSRAIEFKTAIEREAGAAGLVLGTDDVATTVRDLFADFIGEQRALVEALVESRLASGKMRVVPTSRGSVRPRRLLVPADTLDAASQPAAVAGPTVLMPLVPRLPHADALAAQLAERMENPPRPLSHWLVLAASAALLAVMAYVVLFR